MPINTDLLICAPMLQDYLVNKDDGLPLADGVVTMFRDNSRTTLKNWYYQSGSPGAYTYIALPNPLTLSGVGTIQDNNGNDTLPFYYPYDETDSTVFQPYYVTVDNANGERQFTRQNFPFVVNQGSSNVPVASNNNLIVNNVFWRNVGSIDASVLTNSIDINGDTLFYETIAPSQHDGFIMQDIQFFKNENDATDTVSFFQFVPPASNQTFADQILKDDVTPEFYLNINCSGVGTETQKYVQIPLSLHVKSLSGYTDGYITIQAMAVGGSSNGTITVGIFQFLGTGVLSPVVVPAMTIPLGNSWQPYQINIPIPSAANLTLGAGGDDALYIQIGYPTAETFNINVAVPSFYLSKEVPTDDFQTYDEVNAIISSPRTGDIRTSMNSFAPYGWVPMNDGTIGSASSNGTTRHNTDTWPLFNLLWTLAKPYDTGSDFNPICQMFDSAGAATDYSSSAIGDFTLNNQLALTKIFGKVVLGTVPVSALLEYESTTITATNGSPSLVITTAFNVHYFNGMPITFTNTGGSLPGGLTTGIVYYVCAFNGTNEFNVSTTFANAMAYVAVPYSSAGSGTNTVIAGILASNTGEYSHTMILNELFNHRHDALSGNFVNSGGATVYQGAANSGTPHATTGDITGYNSQVPFNVTQPGTFFNIFMKL